jgi:peptidoglycan hydrolase CwlO-like protein
MGLNPKILLVVVVSIASLLVGFGVAQFMLLNPLRAENTEFNQIIVERDSQIAELSTENTELANELTERGEEVTSLSHQLDEFNDTVNELQDSLLEICEENDLLCIQLEMINATQRPPG